MAKRTQAKRTLIRSEGLMNPDKFKAPILAADTTFQINGEDVVLPAGEKYPIISRSRWELAFIRYCDTNQDVLEWASEPWSIPYRNPITGKQSKYVPDFLVAVRQASGRIVKMLIEIKPAHEALKERANSPRDVAKVMENQAKWKAAEWWCQRRGIMFRIMTEHDLFGTPQPKPKKKRAPTRSR